MVPASSFQSPFSFPLHFFVSTLCIRFFLPPFLLYLSSCLPFLSFPQFPAVVSFLISFFFILHRLIVCLFFRLPDPYKHHSLPELLLLFYFLRLKNISRDKEIGLWRTKAGAFILFVPGAPEETAT